MGTESPKFEEPKEITAEELEKFEGPEYEKEKKDYDPIYRSLREKGIDADAFDLKYHVEKRKEDPKDPSRIIIVETKDFTNHHDFLKFQKGLTEEQRRNLFMDIYANPDFWRILNDPNHEICKHKFEEGGVWDIWTKEQNTEIEDEYTKAIRRGEIKEIEKAKKKKPKESLKEKLFGKKSKEGIESEKKEEKPEQKEKNPEEIALDQTRVNYAKAYNEYRKAFGGMKEKDLKAFESVREYIQPGDSEKLKSEDREAKENIEAELRKQNFISSLEEKGISFVKAEAIYNAELKKEEYGAAKVEVGKKLSEQGIEKAEIFKRLVLNEKELLNQAKVESWPPKEKNIFRKGMEGWMKLPRAVKIASSVLLTTGALYGLGAVGITLFGANALAGASMTKLAIFGGKRFYRAFAGAIVGQVVAKGVEKAFFGNLEKIKEESLEKLEQEFSAVEWTPEKLKEFEKKRDEIFETHYKKERNKNLVKAATAIVAGAGTAIGLGFLEQAYAGGGIKTGVQDSPTPKPRVEIQQEPETPPETPPEPLIEAIPQNPPVLEIGNRGPEGAIIDYFRENPDIAEKFGCPKEMVKDGWIIEDSEAFDKWAGMKAHQLWLEDAKEALAKPETVAQLEKLGYSPDAEGYAQMMHRIGKGFVEIDPKTGQMNLVDMEYLKHISPKAPEVLVTETPVPKLPPELQPPFSQVVKEGIEQKINSFSGNPLEISVDDETMDVLNSGTTEKIFENLPSEITRNIITEKIHDNFGLWSGTYDKFSDMKLKDFFNLTNENDARYMTGTPWEDYKYHEISRVQDQAEKVFKALDSAEQGDVAKGNVESFLKKYFVKVFSK